MEEEEEIYEYEPWVTDLIKLINDNKQILIDDAKKDSKQQKYKTIKKIFEYRTDRVGDIISKGLIDYDGKQTLTKIEYTKAEKIANNMNENMKILAKELKSLPGGAKIFEDNDISTVDFDDFQTYFENIKSNDKKRYDEQGHEILDLYDKQNENEDKINDLTEQLKKSEKELEKVKSKLSIYKQKNTTKKETIAKQTEEAKELQNTIEELKKQIEKEQRTKKRYRAERNETRTELTELKEKEKELNGKLKEKEETYAKEIENNKLKVEKEYAERLQKNQEEYDKAYEKVKGDAEKLAKLNKENEDVISELKRKKAEDLERYEEEKKQQLIEYRDKTIQQISEMKNKIEERTEKQKQEELETYKADIKEVYGFAPTIEGYINERLKSEAYTLDKDELIDKINKDIGKKGGVLPKGTNAKELAEAIYARAADNTLKRMKKIANLAMLTGYNPDLYNKLPGDVAQKVQKYITDKIQDDIRKKNIKYILPKDKPRWERAVQTKNLNPMLGRSAWKV